MPHGLYAAVVVLLGSPLLYEQPFSPPHCMQPGSAASHVCGLDNLALLLPARNGCVQSMGSKGSSMTSIPLSHSAPGPEQEAEARRERRSLELLTTIAP